MYRVHKWQWKVQGKNFFISNFLLDFTLFLRNMVQHVKKKKQQQHRKKNTLIYLVRFFTMFLLISLLMKTSLKRLPQHFYHKEWVASNFSIQYPPWVTHYGHENRGNNHQLKEFLIAKQILPVSTLGNV